MWRVKWRLSVNRRSHRLTFCLTLIVAAALALSACVPSEGSSVIRASTTSTPTDSVEASSLCSSTANFIQQSMDGRITGCFRVPDNEGQSLVVSDLNHFDANGLCRSELAVFVDCELHPAVDGRAHHRMLPRPGQRGSVVGRLVTGVSREFRHDFERPDDLTGIFTTWQSLIDSVIARRSTGRHGNHHRSIYLGLVGHEELLRRSLLGRLSKGSRRTRRFSALDRTAVLSGCTEGPFDGVAGD